jgi:hypothetical protein
MFAPSDMTSQTGTAYKIPIDSSLASLTGISGKRRNINGDGRINQQAAAVSASTSWQYICDMWEMQYSASGGTGSYTAVTSTLFPAGVGVGCLSLGTTGAISARFRTKMTSGNIKDLLFPPFWYPVAAPAHPFACAGILAYQDTGVDILVTPTLLSADTTDVFTTMTNTRVGAALTLPTGQLTQLVWEGGNSFQLDTLTNATNGLCLQFDFALPASASTKKLILGDVQFEGGQVCSFYGRTPLSEEERRCRRHYVEFMTGVVNEPLVLIQNLTTTTGAGALRMPESMGKTPTLVLSAASHFSQSNVSGSAVACTALSIANGTTRAVQVLTTVASGLIAGNASQLFANSTSARLALDARL